MSTVIIANLNTPQPHTNQTYGANKFNIQDEEKTLNMNPTVTYGNDNGTKVMVFKGDNTGEGAFNTTPDRLANNDQPAQQIPDKQEVKEALGLLLKMFNFLNTLMGKGENSNQLNTQAPTPPNIEGSQPNGWLVNHGDYTSNADGSFTIHQGEWAGHTATPTDNKGSYEISNTSSGEIAGTFNSPGGQSKIASPLTFDLNGNGQVDTTTANKQFDIDGDGTVDTTAWAGDGDGVLAFDADGDGVSGEDGTELFGNNSDINGDGQSDGYANGFDALEGAAYANLPPENVKRIEQTGTLNEEDIQLLERPVSEGGIGLTMMVDGEQIPPSELGITDISLEYEEAGVNVDANGNEHRQVGTGFTRDGEEYAMNDVWFQYD